jgi:hypothetical protein
LFEEKNRCEKISDSSSFRVELFAPKFNRRKQLHNTQDQFNIHRESPNLFK